MKLERHSPPGPLGRNLIIVIVAVAWATSLLGDLLVAGIVDRNPVLLIALQPRNRNLALAANQISAVSYYVVGFLRLIATDPVNFLVGFWWGEKAIAWIKRRSRSYGPYADQFVPAFRKWSQPLIFLMPNNIICMLAGASGVGVRRFVVLNVTGTIARLIAVHELASYFESPLQSATDFIGEYRIWFFAASALMVAWTVFGEFRGNNSEISSIKELTSDETGPEGNGIGSESDDSPGESS